MLVFLSCEDIFRTTPFISERYPKILNLLHFSLEHGSARVLYSTKRLNNDPGAFRPDNDGARRSDTEGDSQNIFRRKKRALRKSRGRSTCRSTRSQSTSSSSSVPGSCIDAAWGGNIFSLRTPSRSSKLPIGSMSIAAHGKERLDRLGDYLQELAGKREYQ